MSNLSAEYERQRKIRADQWQEKEKIRREERDLIDQQMQIALENLLRNCLTKTVHENITPQMPNARRKSQKTQEAQHTKLAVRGRRAKSHSKTNICKFHNHQCSVHEKKFFSYVSCVCSLGESNVFAGLKTYLTDQSNHKSIHIRSTSKGFMKSKGPKSGKITLSTLSADKQYPSNKKPIERHKSKLVLEEHIKTVHKKFKLPICSNPSNFQFFHIYIP